MAADVHLNAVFFIRSPEFGKGVAAMGDEFHLVIYRTQSFKADNEYPLYLDESKSALHLENFSE